MANTVNLRKGNRVLTVAEELANGYLARGYDQIDKNGKVVKEATGGKKVSVAEYNKLKARLAEAEKHQDAGKAQERVAELEQALKQATEEKVELEQELEKVTEKAKDFAEKGKALKEENDKLRAQNKK